MRARVRAAAFVAGLALFAAPRVAEAAPVLRIEWPVVPGCPDASVVLRRARAAISRSTDVDDVRAVAEITPPATEGGPWLLHVRTRTVRGAGERTLEAPSCDAVARTAALLVAIAALRTRVPAEERSIDELAPAPDRFGEEPAPAAPLAMAPSRWTPESPPRVARTVTEDDGRFVPSAGLGVAFGLLPHAAPTARAALGYELASLTARVAFQASLPQDATSRGVGAELTALGASLDVCHRLPVRVAFRVTTHACAGASVEDVHASGIGGLQVFDVRRTTMMGFAGAGAAWSLGRAFRLDADVRAGASLLRPSFVIGSDEGQRPLHRPAAIRAETTLTFAMTF